MRRSLQVGGMVLILGTLVLVGHLASAPKQTPTPRTRIALINLAQVFKGYHKVTAYANESKKLLEPYQEKAKELKEQIEAHAKALEDKTLPEETRKEHERKRKLRERKMEDLANEAKELYTKKNEAQMLIVYKEVMAEAHRYAKAHDIDLVMHYNDVPADNPEYWKAGNVARKIQAGATIPMYDGAGGRDHSGHHRGPECEGGGRQGHALNSTQGDALGYSVAPLRGCWLSPRRGATE